MPKRRSLVIAAACGIALSTVAQLAAQTKPASGPIARYDMRAGTISGMGAMGAGGAALTRRRVSRRRTAIGCRGCPGAR